MYFYLGESQWLHHNKKRSWVSPKGAARLVLEKSLPQGENRRSVYWLLSLKNLLINPLLTWCCCKEGIRNVLSKSTRVARSGRGPWRTRTRPSAWLGPQQAVRAPLPRPGAVQPGTVVSRGTARHHHRPHVHIQHRANRKGNQWFHPATKPLLVGVRACPNHIRPR